MLALCWGAQIGAIRWDDGLPLDAGRTAAPNPRACAARSKPVTRAAGGPSAGRWPPGVTPHHIKPWSAGGATSLGDMALFCHVHHHYFIHILGWTVTGDPNATLHFTHPGGWLTLDSPLPAR